MPRPAAVARDDIRAAVLARGCPSLADAKRDHPVVFALLLDDDAAVEYWERGRLRVVASDRAPAPATVLIRLLKQHRRFRFAPPDEPAPAESAEAPTPAIAVPETTSPSACPNVWLTALAPSADPSGHVWLARTGRFVNEMVQPSGRKRWTERRLKCPAGESARTGSVVWLLTELS
ncbi:hypothetical protein [Paraburkholderia sp. RL17-373-BIF-A]|uniref:hypothetical protein n=1 Tax=Paraburkholderia sp. RL17-373-BIF-A TaxID=3031629 RepID=UPI0038BBA1F5